MSNNILVSTAELAELIRTDACTVVDCRYDFSSANKGREDWLAGHIPGARYGHLDADLAAPVQDLSGRHPLPSSADFAEFLASIAWTRDRLLVAYDAGSNAISARLWWLMRLHGLPAALLDGGLTAWTEAGYPLQAGENRIVPSAVEHLAPDQGMVVTTDIIHDGLGSSKVLVLDARAAERYSGEVEFLDLKAGHIPGALNRPFGDNLDARGRFRDPSVLRQQFEAVLDGVPLGSVVHSCGSGVTACHNLFAMELAGLGTTRLYPGSWSEWIRDPDRPIKKGEAP